MANLDTVLDEKVRFASGELSLEGVLTYADDREPTRGALLLSPHPHFAGDLDNNVLRRLAPELAAGGWAVLRFNYRGVGDPSMLDYWHGVERDHDYGPVVDDALAARDFLAGCLAPQAPIDWAGYSFGVIVATLAASRPVGAGCLVGVAPPLARFDFDVVGLCGARKAFVLAADDFLYGDAEIRRLEALLAPGDRLEVLDGADHFFRGREADVARRVRERLHGLAEPEDQTEEVLTP